MQSIWENTREGTFEYFAGIKDCYDALTDDLSRRVFWARMALDLGEWDGYMDLIRCSGLMTEAEIQQNYGWVEEFSHSKCPIYIYGAGQFGGRTCQMLQKKGVNVVGFFDRNYTNIVERCGLPVLAPPTKHSGDIRIFITPSLPVNEIILALNKYGIDKQQLLNNASPIRNIEHQYFDFIDYYDNGGAFIDAGCFDFETSVLFDRWSKGQYSQIISFEPDEKNLLVCKEVAKKNNINRVKFVRAGLWDASMIGSFGAFGNDCSCIVEEGGELVQLITLDEVMGEQKVSFIKMDIEGAELPALCGAAQIIMRDRPMCAISVYHKPGDQITLIKYLKELVPQYHFALRHYTNLAIETVLYAYSK